MHRISYACVLLAFAFLLVMYDFYTVFLAFMTILLAPLPSILCCVLARKKAAPALAAPPRLLRGDTALIEVSLPIQRFSFLTIPAVRLDDQLPETVTRDGKASHFRFTAGAAHCGMQSLGTLHLSFTDIFGLTTWRREVETAPQLVLPRRMGRYPAIRAALAALLRPQEKEHFGAVLYHPGDDVHLINWKVTARKEDIYVRDSLPADGSALLLAADLPAQADFRDTVCDALFSCGDALLAGKISFSFLYAAKGNRPCLSVIRSSEDWLEALRHFLTEGSPQEALSAAALPADCSLLCFTGAASVHLPAGHTATLWSADPAAKADLAGRAAIASVLGGDRT